MRFSINSAFAALTALATGAPAIPSNASHAPFYLVTTISSHSNANSSVLANVSATSLFDPFYVSLCQLRLIGPGYGSLPTFTLANGTLHTFASGPHGFPANVEYNSTFVEAGTELQFSGSPEPQGNLAVKGAFLTVNGMRKGWTICAGELEQQVVSHAGVLWWCWEELLTSLADRVERHRFKLHADLCSGCLEPAVLR